MAFDVIAILVTFPNGPPACARSASRTPLGPLLDMLVRDEALVALVLSQSKLGRDVLVVVVPISFDFREVFRRLLFLSSSSFLPPMVFRRACSHRPL